jgi:cell wall-associated NlpC family hydrolase
MYGNGRRIPVDGAQRKLALLSMLLLAAGCASTPRQPATMPVFRSAPPVVVSALKLQGVPYRYGGDTPGEGFDCSGFVQYVYSQHGFHLPRRSEDMATRLPAVKLRERRPGDLLFFNTASHPHTHVGIYLGGDSFIHSPSEHTGAVMVSSLNQSYWSQRLDGIRRPERQLSNAHR